MNHHYCFVIIIVALIINTIIVAPPHLVNAQQQQPSSSSTAITATSSSSSEIELFVELNSPTTTTTNSNSRRRKAYHGRTWNDHQIIATIRDDQNRAVPFSSGCIILQRFDPTVVVPTTINTNNPTSTTVSTQQQETTTTSIVTSSTSTSTTTPTTLTPTTTNQTLESTVINYTTSNSSNTSSTAPTPTVIVSSSTTAAPIVSSTSTTTLSSTTTSSQQPSNNNENENDDDPRWIHQEANFSEGLFSAAGSDGRVVFSFIRVTRCFTDETVFRLRICPLPLFSGGDGVNNNNNNNNNNNQQQSSETCALNRTSTWKFLHCSSFVNFTLYPDPEKVSLHLFPPHSPQSMDQFYLYLNSSSNRQQQITNRIPEEDEIESRLKVLSSIGGRKIDPFSVLVLSSCRIPIGSNMNQGEANNVDPFIDMKKQSSSKNDLLFSLDLEGYGIVGKTRVPLRTDGCGSIHYKDKLCAVFDEISLAFSRGDSVMNVSLVVANNNNNNNNNNISGSALVDVRAVSAVQQQSSQSVSVQVLLLSDEQQSAISPLLNHEKIPFGYEFFDSSELSSSSTSGSNNDDQQQQQITTRMIIPSTTSSSSSSQQLQTTTTSSPSSTTSNSDEKSLTPEEIEFRKLFSTLPPMFQGTRKTRSSIPFISPHSPTSIFSIEKLVDMIQYQQQQTTSLSDMFHHLRQQQQSGENDDEVIINKNKNDLIRIPSEKLQQGSITLVAVMNVSAFFSLSKSSTMDSSSSSSSSVNNDRNTDSSENIISNQGGGDAMPRQEPNIIMVSPKTGNERLVANKTFVLSPNYNLVESPRGMLYAVSNQPEKFIPRRVFGLVDKNETSGYTTQLFFQPITISYLDALTSEIDEKSTFHALNDILDWNYVISSSSSITTNSSSSSSSLSIIIESAPSHFSIALRRIGSLAFILDPEIAFLSSVIASCDCTLDSGLPLDFSLSLLQLSIGDEPLVKYLWGALIGNSATVIFIFFMAWFFSRVCVTKILPSRIFKMYAIKSEWWSAKVWPHIPLVMLTAFYPGIVFASFSLLPSLKSSSHFAGWFFGAIFFPLTFPIILYFIGERLAPKYEKNMMTMETIYSKPTWYRLVAPLGFWTCSHSDSVRFRLTFEDYQGDWRRLSIFTFFRWYICAALPGISFIPCRYRFVVPFVFVFIHCTIVIAFGPFNRAFLNVWAIIFSLGTMLGLILQMWSGMDRSMSRMLNTVLFASGIAAFIRIALRVVYFHYSKRYDRGVAKGEIDDDFLLVDFMDEDELERKKDRKLKREVMKEKKRLKELKKKKGGGASTSLLASSLLDKNRSENKNKNFSFEEHDNDIPMDFNLEEEMKALVEGGDVDDDDDYDLDIDDEEEEEEEQESDWLSSSSHRNQNRRSSNSSQFLARSNNNNTHTSNDENNDDDAGLQIKEVQGMRHAPTKKVYRTAFETNKSSFLRADSDFAVDVILQDDEQEMREQLLQQQLAQRKRAQRMTEAQERSDLYARKDLLRERAKAVDRRVEEVKNFLEENKGKVNSRDAETLMHDVIANEMKKHSRTVPEPGSKIFNIGFTERVLDAKRNTQLKDSGTGLTTNGRLNNSRSESKRQVDVRRPEEIEFVLDEGEDVVMKRGRQYAGVDGEEEEYFEYDSKTGSYISRMRGKRKMKLNPAFKEILAQRQAQGFLPPPRK